MDELLSIQRGIAVGGCNDFQRVQKTIDFWTGGNRKAHQAALDPKQPIAAQKNGHSTWS